jgi:hypothetical protein
MPTNHGATHDAGGGGMAQANRFGFLPVKV